MILGFDRPAARGRSRPALITVGCRIALQEAIRVNMKIEAVFLVILGTDFLILLLAWCLGFWPWSISGEGINLDLLF